MIFLDLSSFFNEACILEANSQIELTNILYFIFLYPPSLSLSLSLFLSVFYCYSHRHPLHHLSSIANQTLLPTHSSKAGNCSHSPSRCLCPSRVVCSGIWSCISHAMRIRKPRRASMQLIVSAHWSVRWRMAVARRSPHAWKCYPYCWRILIITHCHTPYRCTWWTPLTR